MVATSQKKAFLMIPHPLVCARNVKVSPFENVLTSCLASNYVLVGVVIVAKIHFSSVHPYCV
jgi:hypothetical protein